MKEYIDPFLTKKYLTDNHITRKFWSTNRIPNFWVSKQNLLLAYYLIYLPTNHRSNIIVIDLVSLRKDISLNLARDI